MKRKLINSAILTIILFCLTSLSINAQNQADITGKYIRSRNHSDYILLKTNGTFELKQGTDFVKGTYKYDYRSKRIKMKFIAYGLTIYQKAYIKSGKLIDKDREVWKKFK